MVEGDAGGTAASGGATEVLPVRRRRLTTATVKTIAAASATAEHQVKAQRWPVKAHQLRTQLGGHLLSEGHWRLHAQRGCSESLRGPAHTAIAPPCLRSRRR